MTRPLNEIAEALENLAVTPTTATAATLRRLAAEIREHDDSDFFDIIPGPSRPFVL
ncbi:hypothetical protein [Agromyces ramosus]|uniref:FXSXX-COOH protein n=1 Tax=Agromyces ramosus TaxID=33879 RepID=A0ABU0R8Q5_9MICO|nr:hypothetical protein [Agromyces ramosus]MDQ0894452.1 hypothetical protein [Agromyces ramosus]